MKFTGTQINHLGCRSDRKINNVGCDMSTHHLTKECHRHTNSHCNYEKLCSPDHLMYCDNQRKPSP